MEPVFTIAMIALYVLLAVVGLFSIPLGAYWVGSHMYDRWPVALAVFGTAVATIIIVLGGWMIFDIVFVLTWLQRRIRRLVHTGEVVP